MTVTDEMVEAARAAYRRSCLEGPNEPMFDALTAALLIRQGGVKALDVDEIEAIILATEPDIPACVDGSGIWTKRMAFALSKALASPAQEIADEGATHRHKKRGTEYVLIGIGRMQSEWWLDSLSKDGDDPIDMREVAIYRSATDPTEIWVRPREEFEDGRFETLTPQVTP